MIIAVNNGLDSRATIEKYWSSSGFTLPAVMTTADQEGGDLSGIAKDLGARIFPTNIVVGPDGKVLFAGTGFNEARIRELLGVR